MVGFCGGFGEEGGGFRGVKRGNNEDWEREETVEKVKDQYMGKCGCDDMFKFLPDR